MVNRIKTKKKAIAKKIQGALHLKFAYNLGRTVKKVSKTVNAVKKSANVRIRRKPSEPLPPVLKEIKAIADISGLSAAIREMNEISLEHSNHPVINRITAAIEGLSTPAKEALSRKFIEHLGANPGFSDPMASLGTQQEMSEEDCQKISGAFIESIFYTLEDVGITEKEKEFLHKFSGDMTRPINDLVQFYLHPKTFAQKVKRLWRMQRILIKMIKLIHMTNTVAQTNAGPMIMDITPQQKGPSVIFLGHKN